MQRTNIYLAPEQCNAIKDLARAQGISRAELIRRLLDRALFDQVGEDLAGDLAAIEASFAILQDEEMRFERSADDRAKHLQRVGDDDPG